MTFLSHGPSASATAWVRRPDQLMNTFMAVDLIRRLRPDHPRHDLRAYYPAA